MTSISDALGMKPLIIDAEYKESVSEEAALPAVVEPIPQELSQIDKEAEEDFAIARKNTQDLLHKAEEALDGILRIAAGSEHPRAFEVAANLLKTAADLQAGLLKLHEQRRQLVPDPEGTKAAEAGPTNQTNIQNNFYGSTQDFLDMLEQREKDREENDGSST